MMYFRYIAILIILRFNYCVDSTKMDTETIPQLVHRRHDFIPIININGSHYEIGYLIGKTFGNIIREFVDAYKPLKSYLEAYNTEEGKQIYSECLEVTEMYFLQYVIELKGMAIGAGVDFHHLFLIHMDQIIMINNTNINIQNDTNDIGCSTLMINSSKLQFIGHNEDALSETIMHVYIVSAHIIPADNERGGVFDVREEKWTSLTYAGSLSGYASGYNYHGLVYSINTIFAKNLMRKRIPRVFLTRALLASKADLSEIQHILSNFNVGTADAFHVNAGLLSKNSEQSIFYSIEVTPSNMEQKSNVVTKTVKDSSLFYVNRLKYTKTCEELKESAWESSIAREKLFFELTKISTFKSLNDALRILGATQIGKYQIYTDKPNDPVNTINTGVFDFKKKNMDNLD